MTTLPLSLVVITLNEAAQIGQCLDSVPFLDDKLVVDAGSSDHTCEIAAAHGARVVHQPWLGFGPQRRFATSLARHDWILVLDADESLSPSLATELDQRLPAILTSDAAGGEFRRTTLFMGKAMRWYRPMTGERILRLYHRGRGDWTTNRVHEHLRLSGRVEKFKYPIEHRHNPTLLHRQLKMMRYTELKIRDWRDRGRSARLWECPLVFASTFIRDYLLRLGILDGSRGYAIAHMAAAYAVQKRLRYFELLTNPHSEQQALETLRHYGLEH